MEAELPAVFREVPQVQIAFAESWKLFNAAKEPKRPWVVPEAAHEDFLAFDPVGHDHRGRFFLD